ncbi:MAG: hypothetical protein SGI74_13085 [Oligoflexia bacterium]|nr:hypothetical protein [Oligoflexia bacterium]
MIFFKRSLLFASVILSTQIFLAQNALAWSYHHLVTKAALSHILELRDEKVVPTPFSELVRALGYANADEFNQSILINKKYIFSPKLNEKPGVPIKAIEILTTYSDEPDWGMDIALFEPDQYPQLWKDEYAMMGGKKGTSSQGFRHMYWQSLTLRDPIITFKLPITKTFSSMGQSPQRALDFVRLARRAAAKNQRYWSLRFLANALHYLEDVSQPFHAAQTPTKKFIAMPFKDEMGSGKKDFVLQMQHIIEYYHHAFEEYVGRLMKMNAEGAAHPDAAAFVNYLSGMSTETSELPNSILDIKLLTEKMAALAAHRGARTGQVSLDFFPRIKVSYVELDIDVYMDQPWWNFVMAQGQLPSEARTQYMAIVREMFVTLGDAIRRVVMAEAKVKNTMFALDGVER